MHIHDELVIEADPRMSLTLSVNRWAGHRLGRKVSSSALMATLQTFIKKIKNHPLKSGVHLQWEAEVDAFFYVRPERRTPA
jgi:predicted hydrocarbon binding protein